MQHGSGVEVAAAHIQSVGEAEVDFVTMKIFVAELRHQKDPRHSVFARRADALLMLIEEARRLGKEDVALPGTSLS